jgi:hypothetical protein
MFQDVDETLRAALIADVPIKKNEIDVAFDRPTRDWSSRLTRPTLNLFMADIRERVDLKDDVDIVTRDEAGKAVRQRPPKRVDLAYLVSAWTTEPDDEHRILARVLSSMYRYDTIPPELLQGDLKNSKMPVLARVPEPEQSLKGQDLWGALGNDLHASLTWTWTVPLDVFKPSTGPLVRTAEIRVGPSGAGGRPRPRQGRPHQWRGRGAHSGAGHRVRGRLRRRRPVQLSQHAHWRLQVARPTARRQGQRPQGGGAGRGLRY